MKKHNILAAISSAAIVISLFSLLAVEEKSAAPASDFEGTVAGHPIRSGQRISDFEFRLMRVTLPKPSTEAWTRGDIDSKNAFDVKNQRHVVENIANWIRMDMRDPGVVIQGVRHRFHDPRKVAGYLNTLIQFIDIKNEVISTTAALELYRLGDPGDLGYKKMRAILEADIDVKLFKNPVTAHGPSGSCDARQVILDHASFYKDARFLDAAEALWDRQQKAGTEDLEKVDVAWYLEVNGKPRPGAYWLGRLDKVKVDQAFSRNGLRTTLMVLEHRQPKGVVELLEAKFKGIEVHFHKEYAQDGDVHDYAGLKKILAASLLRLTKDRECRQYLVTQVKEQIKNQLSESTTQAIMDGLAADGHEYSMAILDQAIEKGSVGVKQAALIALSNARNPKAISLLLGEAEKSLKKSHFPRLELYTLLSQNSAEADAQYDLFKKKLLSDAPGWESNFEALDFYRIYGRDEVLPPLKPEAPPTSGNSASPSISPPTSPGLK